MSSKFVHLHTHSHYSLLDGLAKIDDIVDRVKKRGMDAVAVTDHGVIYGAIEFYQKAKKAGIKPILGVEAYIAPKSRLSKEAGDRYYHLILLCENITGWKNLLKLVTKANLEGYYYKPRMDKELLREYHEGLIALSGCLGGEVDSTLLTGNYEEAKRIALEYRDIFGKGNFFLEIQKHPHIPDSERIESLILQLSKETDIPLVATQDSHYADREDAEYHDVLLAVQTGNKLSDDDRLTLKADDFSIMSPEDITEKFAFAPEAIENTVKIAERCNVELKLHQTLLPHFQKPEGFDSNQYLRHLVEERIENRFPGETKTKDVLDRVEYELSVIEKTGYADYFLIVQDLIMWAKLHGIAVGPGRGSAAGSIASYILGITDLNPLSYDLLFERFLNPDRIQMPDIDIDFADRRRDEVIAYTRQKYGEDRVAQIITFGTMAARAAVRDAGRAMGISYGFCDQLAKLIPFNMDLAEAIEKVPELSELYTANAEAKKLLDAAKRLEGVARHASVHACGTVISKEPLTDYVALQFSPQDKNIIITQFEMHAIEDIGLLKIDFLGLRNLTIIEETLRLVRELKGENINISTIPLDDAKAFELLQAGDTTGVFQFESAGMRRYMKEIKPNRLEDLIALVALYRPGPMELISSFIARKNGKEPISYLHPNLEPILKNTYGIGVYQEQMMRIARDLAGYTLAEADTLRKAIGKKIKSLLDEQQEKLTNGMVKNGIPLRIAKQIWELFPPFARYGFNKCVTADTKIQNAETGELVTIKKLLNKKRYGATLSINNKSKIIRNEIANAVHNGKRPVFELITRSGRRIKATSNHPLLSPSGWRNLEDLTAGDRIATPRILPEPTKPIVVAYHKLAVLGYLIAEGNLCHPSGFYCYSKSEDEVSDYVSNLEKFRNTLATVDRSKPAISVYARRRNAGRASAAVEWIDSLGIRGKTATKKHLPEFVFQLGNADLAVVAAKMFQGDGCINIKNGDLQIFYATSSRTLADQFQHILLRFGILSTIHVKKFNYRGATRPGYTVNISRHDNIRKFMDSFSGHFVGEKKATSQKIARLHPILNGSLKLRAARGSKDTIPSFLALPALQNALVVAGMGPTAVARKFGFAARTSHSDRKKKGFLRETVQELSIVLESETLGQISETDIYWDEVRSIVPAGTEDVYDIEMKGDHNFVANDIFVHNSHAACYALIGYQTAYLKAHYPEEFMASLFNAELSDIDRISFLVGEAKAAHLEVLPPDVNRSSVYFAPEGAKLRFGLLAVKNVGGEIVKCIIEERNRGGSFKDFKDFLTRIQHKDLNKKSLESLSKCGAFDSLGIERNQALVNLDEIVKFASSFRKETTNGGNSLFGAPLPVTRELKLTPAPPATREQKLAWEKELIGFYLSDHPLNAFKERIEKNKIPPIQDVLQVKDESKVMRIVGLVSGVKKIITKSGQPMLFATVEDLSPSPIEVIVFNSVLLKTAPAWEQNNIVLVQGRMSWKGGEAKFICDNAKKVEPEAPTVQEA